MTCSMEQVEKLRRIAQAYRRSIEELLPQLPLWLFGQFPRGTCGHVSDLLGTYLIETGFQNVTYISGWHPSLEPRHSHAWLDVDGVATDITADQFGSNLAPTIVEMPSSWHAGFEEQQRRVASIANSSVAGELFKISVLLAERLRSGMLA